VKNLRAEDEMPVKISNRKRCALDAAAMCDRCRRAAPSMHTGWMVTLSWCIISPN